MVKLFSSRYTNGWKRHAQTSDELERAMRDMIVDSSNDATGLVVDVLTELQVVGITARV